MGPGLQGAEARHLFFAKQIIADQDVVDAGVRHHLRFAELLAGNALGTGCELELRQHRALVGLDMRAVGDAGGIAGLLHPRDVAFDPVHVDDGNGWAVFAGDLGGKGSGHSSDSSVVVVIARSNATKQSSVSRAEPWIASRSLSSGAHSRDPLARNDVGKILAQACSISSRNTSSSSHLSSASCNSFCA